MRLIITLSAVSLLGACTTGAATGSNSYAAQYAQLGDDCRARGGVLVATGAAPSGNPATEYACEVRSGGVLTD